MHAIAQKLVLQHVPSGELIYRLGERSDSLLLVDEGEVELTAENESGVLQELARVEVGSYFGAMSLLTGEDRAENATAIGQYESVGSCTGPTLRNWWGSYLR